MATANLPANAALVDDVNLLSEQQSNRRLQPLLNATPVFGMKETLPLVLGLLALLTTTALICDTIVLAVHISDDALIRTTSLISAALEIVVGALLVWFVSTTVLKSMASILRRSSTKRLAASFGCAAAACLLAAAMSIVNVACLANLVDTEGSSSNRQNHLIASSTILAIAVVCQLSFLGLHFLKCRRNQDEGAESLYTNDEPRASPRFYVKSVPYSRTRPSMAESRPTTSAESVDMASLDEKKFAHHVMASPRSSTSQSLRSIPSRTRLEAIKEKQRLPSLDSNVYRPSVDDPENRDASSGFIRQESSPTVPSFPKSRLLETIPASPVVPENPAGIELATELEPPPPIRQRSRSYSPVARKPRSTTSSPTPSASAEELNIHPLFRSDSPTPPPIATSGTSVMASPDAGKVLPHRPSNQSLRRLRSSSAASNCSPLSRRTSFDAPSLRRPCDEQDSIVEEGEETETEEELVPPIPEFVMGAGCRSSLTRYNSKHSDHGTETQ